MVGIINKEFGSVQIGDSFDNISSTIDKIVEEHNKESKKDYEKYYAEKNDKEYTIYQGWSDDNEELCYFYIKSNEDNKVDEIFAADNTMSVILESGEQLEIEEFRKKNNDRIEHLAYCNKFNKLIKSKAHECNKFSCDNWCWNKCTEEVFMEEQYAIISSSNEATDILIENMNNMTKQDYLIKRITELQKSVTISNE